MDDETASEHQTSESTDDESPFGDGAAEWFAASTLRIGLAIVGLVLLLVALGQVAGLDLLGLVVDALSTSTGRWLIVAFVALVLIAVAARGFGTPSE